jgi:sulfhydrogenase subunit beta (sulfur reductase)
MAGPPRSVLLPRPSLDRLLEALRARGYRVLGPTVRDAAVVWDEVARATDLPLGWRDVQEPGRYRLERTDSARLFGVVHGPDSLKRFAFAPRERLLVVERCAEGLTSRPVAPAGERLAIVGARACDLAGLAIQDRIFLRDAFPDPYYAARREGLFIVAVHCTRALSTCFCASTETGPRAASGFDLALFERDDGFLVEAGSAAGEAVLEGLALAPATAAELAEADAAIDACARGQSRRLPRAGLPRALYEAHDHPRWDDVAARCLACTNCTMVCPTCFCHTVEEIPDLARQRSEHGRAWDSCFTPDHGYIHGKNVRPTIRDRYRMWLTHKVAAWIDQFGMSGCVGCGRCITWCPVGIDITEEVAALTATAPAAPGTPGAPAAPGA